MTKGAEIGWASASAGAQRVTGTLPTDTATFCHMMNLSSRRVRRQVVVILAGLVAGTVVLARFATVQGPQDSRAHVRSSSTPSPSISRTPRPSVVAPHTLAGMARHPCRALDDADVRTLRIRERSHEKRGAHPRCAWFVRGATALFAPQRSKNVTRLRLGPHARDFRLHGHRGVQIFLRKNCYTLVSVGAKASFAVIVYPRKHGSTRLSRRFGILVATAIVAHLTERRP